MSALSLLSISPAALRQAALDANDQNALDLWSRHLDDEVEMARRKRQAADAILGYVRRMPQRQAAWWDQMSRAPDDPDAGKRPPPPTGAALERLQEDAAREDGPKGGPFDEPAPSAEPTEARPTSGSVKDRLQAALRKTRLQTALQETRPRSPQGDKPLHMQSLMEKLTGEPSPYLTAEQREAADAGSTEAGRRIIADTPAWKPGRFESFVGQAANSLTFGQAPAIEGAIGMLGGLPYEEGVKRTKELLALQQQTHPLTSMAGDVTGFLAPGSAIFKGVMRGAKPVVAAAQRFNPFVGFLAKSLGVGTAGAVDSAAYGGTVAAERDAQQRASDGPLTLKDLLTGAAETKPAGNGSPSLQDRIDSALAWAPGGFGIGAAGPTAEIALRPVARAISGGTAHVKDLAAKIPGVDRVFTPGAVARHDANVGAAAARRDLERSGIVTIEDFLRKAAKYGNKPVVAGELGQSALNSLTSLVRGKGTSAEKAMAILEDRVAGMPGRMLRDVAAETGLSPEAIMGNIEEMMKAGRERAAPLYKAAEAQPFAKNSGLDHLLKESPTAKRAFDTAQKRLRDEAASLGVTLDQMPKLRIYDEMKRVLDEDVQEAVKFGRSPYPIEQVRASLVQQLDKIVPETYAAAREAGGDAPRIEEAFKRGQKALSSQYIADDIEREVAKLWGQPLTSFQSGTIRDIVKRVEAGTMTPRVFKTPAYQKKLRSIFGDAAAEGLIRKFGIEAELMQKGARWNPNVGSVTSQAMKGEPSQVDDLMSAGAHLLTGNKIGAWRKLMNFLHQQGYSEGQRNAIGNIFLSSPEEASRMLYGDAKPRAGSVPPPTPPAGQVRTNPQPHITAPSGTMGDKSAFDANEIAGALGGTAAGVAAPADKPEDRFRNALIGMITGYGIGRGTKGLHVDPAKLGAMGANLSRAPTAEQAIAQKYAPKGFKTGFTGYNGRGPRRQFEPRDVVLAYNDGSGLKDLADDFGLAQDGAAEGTLSALAHYIRKSIGDAIANKELTPLARAWNVTPDELQKFLIPRAHGANNAGKFDSFLSSVADIVEGVNKTGRKISIPELVDRLRETGIHTTEGSLKARLSQARSANGAGKQLSPETLKRVQNLQIRGRGRPSLESPPEVGGAVVGGAVGGFSDDDGNVSLDHGFNPVRAAVGAGLGAVGGSMLRGGERGAIGSGMSRRAQELLANGDIIENPTQRDLARLLRDQTGGEKLVRLLKDPATGKSYAFDGSLYTHDDMLQAMGMDRAKTLSGRVAVAEPSSIQWETGDGRSANTLDKKFRQEMNKGRDAKDVYMDLTPDEIAADLRGIGAAGPGKDMRDYPYRRKLATEGARPDITGVGFDGPADSRVSIATKSTSPSLFFTSPPRRPLTRGESGAMFSKAFAIMEREAIRSDHDVISVSGLAHGHNALYRGTLERLGAPQGFIGAIPKDPSGPGGGGKSLLLIRSDRFSDLVNEGRLNPDDWTLIPSKRGEKPVPEWRRQTGLFSLPPMVALMAAQQKYGQEKAPGR